MVTDIGSARARKAVVTHDCRGGQNHSEIGHVSLARTLAATLDLDYAGAVEECGGRTFLYHFPRRTLCGHDQAARLAVTCEDDLFGGWVAEPFMATKAIVHPIVSERAVAPSSWLPAFAREVEGVVLAGFTAFDASDAAEAGHRLLARGPLRLKPVLAEGARGQVIVRSEDEFEKALAAVLAGNDVRDGLVLEENLSDVGTASVGEVRAADLKVAYFGIQSLTDDNAGEKVYGGSALYLVRGDMDGLLKHPLDERARRCVAAARVFDRAADVGLAGFFASRRNYDIVFGTAADGAQRLAVLEQSWRAGGATGAEIAALALFRTDPGIVAVRARTVERYGDARVPDGAVVHYRGDDPELGPLVKYTVVDDVIRADDRGRHGR